MSVRGGREPLWVGGYRMHFVLPTPLCGPGELALLDQAVCGGCDSWQPVGSPPCEPVLGRAWRAATGEWLYLGVLSCYPLLATLGAPRLRGRCVREVIDRAVVAVQREKGQLVGDSELALWIKEIEPRWRQASRVMGQLEQARKLLHFRCCVCQIWTSQDAAHCRGCGHRFSPAQDLERDQARRHAAGVIEEHEATLRSLGRGQGLLLDRLSSASGVREPSTSLRHGVVV